MALRERSLNSVVEPNAVSAADKVPQRSLFLISHRGVAPMFFRALSERQGAVEADKKEMRAQVLKSVR